MRLRPTSLGTCRYPDVKPITSYSYGCRCDRCKQGHREYGRKYKQTRTRIVCDRCSNRGEIQIRGVELCGSPTCITDEDRQLILADTLKGRYGNMGRNDGQVPM